MKYNDQFFPLTPSDLTELEFHHAMGCIRRFTTEAFPVHLSVHNVHVAEKEAYVNYSIPYDHTNWDEINILLTKDSLIYAISINEEVHEVAASTVVWIPAGFTHSANVISGSGFFVCIRLANTTKRWQ
jgi:hypothetical protein